MSSPPVVNNKTTELPSIDIIPTDHPNHFIHFFGYYGTQFIELDAKNIHFIIEDEDSSLKLKVTQEHIHVHSPKPKDYKVQLVMNVHLKDTKCMIQKENMEERLLSISTVNLHSILQPRGSSMFWLYLLQTKIGSVEYNITPLVSEMLEFLIKKKMIDQDDQENSQSLKKERVNQIMRLQSDKENLPPEFIKHLPFGTHISIQSIKGTTYSPYHENPICISARDFSFSQSKEIEYPSEKTKSLSISAKLESIKIEITKNPFLECKSIEFNVKSDWTKINEQRGPNVNIEGGINNFNVNVIPSFAEWILAHHNALSQLLSNDMPKINSTPNILEHMFLDVKCNSENFCIIIFSDKNEELTRLKCTNTTILCNAKEIGAIQNKSFVKVYEMQLLSDTIDMFITEKTTERKIDVKNYNVNFGRILNVEKLHVKTTLLSEKPRTPIKFEVSSVAVSVGLSIGCGDSIVKLSSHIISLIDLLQSYTPKTKEGQFHEFFHTPATIDVHRVQCYMLDEESLFYSESSSLRCNIKFPTFETKLSIVDNKTIFKTKLHGDLYKEYKLLSFANLDLTSEGTKKLDVIKVTVNAIRFTSSMPLMRGAMDMAKNVNEIVDQIHYRLIHLILQVLLKMPIPVVVLHLNDIQYFAEFTVNTFAELSIADIKTNDILKEISIHDIEFAIIGEKLLRIGHVNIFPGKHPIQQELHKSAFSVYHQKFIEKHGECVPMSESTIFNYSQRRHDVKQLYITIELHNTCAFIPNKSNLGHAFDEIGMGFTLLQEHAKKQKKPQFLGESKSSEEPLEKKQSEEYLPPRLFLKMVGIKFEVEDNPIDRSLAIHQQIWQIEAMQRDEREQLLMKRIAELNISHEQKQKMRIELQNQNSKIYYDRISYFLKNNTRPTGMLTAEVKLFEIDLFRNSSILTEEGIVEKIQELDDSSTGFPKDEKGNLKPFDSLFATSFRLKFSKVIISMRSLPLPFFDIESGSLKGTIIMARFPPREEDTVLRTINFGFGNTPVPHCLSPTHIYYDVIVELKKPCVASGTAYGPLFEDIAMLFESISPKNLDPSPRMEWWDVARRICHGRYNVVCRDVNCKLLIGVNTYDPTDSLEMNVRYLNGKASTGRYEIYMENLNVHQNPCLSYFHNIVEFPKTTILLDFWWECEMDPFDCYFNISLPKEFRTEEGIETYKNKIVYDGYKKWRSYHLHCDFKGKVEPGLNTSCNSTQPSIMYDPLTTSWFLKFVMFMKDEPLQVFLGKSYKFGKNGKRHQYEVLDFIKSFQIDLKFFDTNFIWSNGVSEGNKIARLNINELQYYTLLHRDELPNIKIPKPKRPKNELLPIKTSANITEVTAFIYSYYRNDINKEKKSREFGEENRLLRIQQIAFFQDVSSDKKDIIPVVMPKTFIDFSNDQIKKQLHGYEMQLLINGLQAFWNTDIRDAIFIMIDIGEQFAFQKMEVDQKMTLENVEKLVRDSKLEEKISLVESKTEEEVLSLDDMLKQSDINNDKKDHIQNKITSKFFSIVLNNVEAVIQAAEANDCLIIGAPTGYIEIHNILEENSNQKSQEFLAILKEFEVLVANTENLVLEDCWMENRIMLEDSLFYKIIDPCTCIFTVNLTPESKKGPITSLDVEIPQLEMAMTSAHIQILVDIITNVLIPQKVMRTILLEDYLKTLTYESKLDPEKFTDIEEVKKRCLQVRNDIRYLENVVNTIRKNAVQSLNKQVVNDIMTVEKQILEKKIIYFGMKTLLYQLVQKRIDESLSNLNNPKVDELTNIIIHNCKWKMVDRKSMVFMEVILTLFRGTIVKYIDGRNTHTFSLHSFMVKNRLPNPIYEDMVMPYLEKSEVISENDYMLRVVFNRSRSIGGIDGFDHLEIELSPVHVQLTYDIYKYLWSYFFPLSKLAKEHDLHAKRPIKNITMGTTTSLTEIQTLLSQEGIFISNFEQLQSGNRNSSEDIDLMRYRAKNTKIFNYIRIQEVQLFVSFLGPETNEFMKVIHNFEKCKIKLKPITYNSKAWTWEDLFENLKKDVITQCLAYSLPSTVKSVTKNKFKGVTNMIKTATQSRSPSEKPKESRKLSRTQKFQMHLSKLKNKVLEKGIEIKDDTSLKKMLIFGNAPKEDVRKKFFGEHYQSFTKSHQDDPNIEIFDDENVDKDLIDALTTISISDDDDDE